MTSHQAQAGAPRRPQVQQSKKRKKEEGGGRVRMDRMRAGRGGVGGKGEEPGGTLTSSARPYFCWGSSTAWQRTWTACC